MASWRTALIAADVLSMAERVETFEGRHTVICKPGIYEEIQRSMKDLAKWDSEEGFSFLAPVVIGGVVFKPSDGA